MALEPGELTLIIVVILGVGITFFVIFWEGVVRALRRGSAAPAAAQGPLPMADYTKYVWNGEDIGAPPTKRSVILAYDNPQRISMSFFVDLTKKKGCYLDPVKAIRINGDIVQIKDLPADPEKLRAVKKESVDITKYVRTGPQGLPNDFEVNYIVQGRFAGLRGPFGKMTLVLAVMMPKGGGGIVGPTKFCMSCQYSMPLSAKFCPNCGVPVEAFSGTETKECVNCKETIAANAMFCSNCGAAQPTQPSQPAVPPEVPAAPS
jgi:RNA polymerase subunit RPABC4/transcription elongation factor Spt4